jgi:putative nucleotidyltransferase with HDIG domain
MLKRYTYNEIINKSHDRCSNYGVKKDIPRPSRILKDKEFQILIQKNKQLIEIAKPFMEILYNFLKGSGFSLYFTEKRGVVLTIIGDEDIIRDQTEMGIIEGADMSEKSAGTNGIGTAIFENNSLQISGEQHFIKVFHVWTCSSAVIHNEDGDIIGCLNLTGRRQLAHPHTLGLVVAAVKSIENQLKVEKAQKEVSNQIREAGEQSTFETSVHGIHPELITLLGRLKFRTSYGQNVLKHSIEVAHLSGLMAAELGVDVQLAKRAGLLHDIGKSVDHEVEGPHVTIGVDLAKKYREGHDVVHAIAAHHGDEEPQTIVAVLVQAADAISAARPGARRETLESYIKRLTKLEEIANSFEGVDKSFAIQAGREVRIMVKPDKVDDLGAVRLVRDINKRIEVELDYPGQIKVVIIRETRVVEYAK